MNVFIVLKENFSIITEGNLVKTSYFGDVHIDTIHQVLSQWSSLRVNHQELSVFLFDYSKAKMVDIDFQHAIDIASHPIFSSGSLQDIYIIGVLTDRRDYALCCLWASQLFKSQTFPRENVFLYRCLEEAETKILSIQNDVDLTDKSN